MIINDVADSWRHLKMPLVEIRHPFTSLSRSAFTHPTYDYRMIHENWTHERNKMLAKSASDSAFHCWYTLREHTVLILLKQVLVSWTLSTTGQNLFPLHAVRQFSYCLHCTGFGYWTWRMYFNVNEAWCRVFMPQDGFFPKAERCGPFSPAGSTWKLKIKKIPVPRAVFP